MCPALPPSICVQESDVVTWTLGDQAYDASGSVSYTVMVTHPLISGTLLLNTATITDQDGVSSTTELTTPIHSSHILQIAKVVTPAVALPSALLTYTIAYSVSGNEPAQDVTLSDLVPQYTIFYTATPVPDSYPPVGTRGMVVWHLGTLLTETSGITIQTGFVSLVVAAQPSLPDGLVIPNTATISDTTPLSTSSTASVTVESSHSITVVKTSPVTSAELGDLITYTLEYTVAGDEQSTPFIRDDVGSPSVFVTASGGISMETPASGATGTVLWYLGTLSPTPDVPATGTVTLTVRVAGLVSDGEIVENAASIHSGGMVNNSVATVTMLAPTLHFVKRSTPSDAVRPSDVISYQLCYSNTGSVTATQSVITDMIPANTSFVPGSADNGPGTVQYHTESGWHDAEPEGVNGLRWRIPEVAPGGGRVLCLLCRPGQYSPGYRGYAGGPAVR